MRPRCAQFRLLVLAFAITGLVIVLLATAPARLRAQRPPVGPMLVPTDVRVTSDAAGNSAVVDGKPGQDLYLHFTLSSPPMEARRPRLRALARMAPVKVRIAEKTHGAHGLLLRKQDQRKMPFDEPNVPVGTRYTVRLQVAKNLAQIFDNVVIVVTAQPGTPNERSAKASPFRVQPVVIE